MPSILTQLKAIPAFTQTQRQALFYAGLKAYPRTLNLRLSFIVALATNLRLVMFKQNLMTGLRYLPQYLKKQGK